MLVESIVQQTLGIKRHVVKGVLQTEMGIEVELDIRKRWKQECGTCGTLGRVRDRLQPRSWKHVPLWGIPVTLVFAPARVTCANCENVRVASIPWSQGKCRLSVGLIWLLAAWCKLLAWDQVAKLFGVHWNTVATAVRQAVAYGLEHREIGGVIYIGVDELSRKKGHVYVTNVYDLSTRRLLWSGEGRSKETLRRFFDEHASSLKNTVKGVCCDMWRPYIEMISEHLPEATLVFDKFHRWSAETKKTTCHPISSSRKRKLTRHLGIDVMIFATKLAERGHGSSTEGAVGRWHLPRVHRVSRGQHVFRDDGEAERLEDLLAATKERDDFQILAWCIESTVRHQCVSLGRR